MYRYLLDINTVNTKVCERKDFIGGNLLKSFQISQNNCRQVNLYVATSVLNKFLHKLFLYKHKSMINLN